MDSSNYATYESSYPLISYGLAGDICGVDEHCTDGLVCKLDERWGGRTCRPSKPLDHTIGCQRTNQDKRCHKVIGDNKIMCDESACGGVTRYHPVNKDMGTYSTGYSGAPGKATCDGAEKYYHNPTQTSFCIRETEAGGVTVMSPICC